MKKAADCQLVADGPRFYYRLQYDKIPGSAGAGKLMNGCANQIYLTA